MSSCSMPVSSRRAWRGQIYTDTAIRRQTLPDGAGSVVKEVFFGFRPESGYIPVPQIQDVIHPE
jgi:hypothetical protein